VINFCGDCDTSIIYAENSPSLCSSERVAKILSHDLNSFEMSYGEYVKFIAHNESKYSDILGDYTGSTEGQSSGSLDEWD